MVSRRSSGFFWGFGSILKDRVGFLDSAGSCRILSGVLRGFWRVSSGLVGSSMGFSGALGGFKGSSRIFSEGFWDIQWDWLRFRQLLKVSWDSAGLFGSIMGFSRSLAGFKGFSRIFGQGFNGIGRDFGSFWRSCGILRLPWFMPSPIQLRVINFKFNLNFHLHVQPKTSTSI